MNSFLDLEERYGKVAAEKVESIVGNLEIVRTDPSPATYEFCRATLVGFAIGETLGFPMEDMTRSEILRNYPTARDVLSRQSAETGSDSLLTLITTDSILADPKTHPQRLAARLTAADLNTSGRAVIHAQRQLRNGANWYQSGLEDSAGIAAAARSASFGLVWSNDPLHAAYEAAISASVTHGHPMATSAAAAFAAGISLAVKADSLGNDWINEISKICEKFAQRDVNGINLVERIRLLSTLESADADAVINLLGTGPVAFQALPTAIWCAANATIPLNVLLKVVAAGGDTDTIAAMTGALLGACHGPSIWEEKNTGLPELQNFSGLQELDDVAKRISTFAAPQEKETLGESDIEKDIPVNVCFLLDRSGSMSGLEEDVVGGFNSFLNTQKNSEGSCSMTVVQFDGGDPFEILRDADPVETISELKVSDYTPRGMTPLLDALGQTIEHADTQLASMTGEVDQIVAVFTDGLENASRRWTHQALFQLIEERKKAGWTFVFLGANQDSYATGSQLGLDDGSIQNFRGDKQGMRAAMASFDRSLDEYRRAPRADKLNRKQNFYNDLKEAELDHTTRK